MKKKTKKENLQLEGKGTFSANGMISFGGKPVQLLPTKEKGK
jgi:hypothetical protein